MPDPILTKVPLRPADPGTERGGDNSLKTGDSKFDKVRARLLDEQAQHVQLPEIKPITSEQKKLLHADLQQRMAKSGANSPEQVLAVDMKQAKQRIEHLQKRVNALPETAAFEPFRSRLTTLDMQYQQTGRLVHSVKGGESPEEIMKIQVQMYELTENLELMSKVVEQITSGVKSILQTQV